MLQYRKGSLFDAPKGSILVHACNAQGVWGAGIAAEFKERFPESFKQYEKYCQLNRGITGVSFGTTEDIICLITSSGYGRSRETQEVILGNTLLALKDIFSTYEIKKNETLHSNKFNSGLFGVAWNHTETILKGVLIDQPDLTWVVWDPELEEKGNTDGSRTSDR